MRRLPELKVEFIHDYSIPKEEAIKKIDEMFGILFKETIEGMEKSSDPTDVAFLEKFPYLKERK